ncbi:MAG: CBS domain-containing protein [candidate division Zixibacteria bacterium]|nr:CBS domain-containing protein [candidate division Zixibacteria bacterium]MDH3935698.1 CBS domain-containing protein [candidate division Zixibacteria bacterium]MDH4034443.1 CBS domain-containing protein [candidate division Zixibacteria bacterium]
MNLANLIMERRISINLRAKTKDEAVIELLDLIKHEGVQLDFDSILKSIREREDIENTSYGHGFAFPHARTDAVNELYILIGVSKEGLVGKTADGIPSHVICLLLTPSTIAKLYLQMLSGLAAFGRVDGTLEKVLAVTRPVDLIKLISDAGLQVDKELMVKDVMRHKVACVTPDNTLKDVANEMFRFRLSALAVVDERNKLLGVIDDRDLIKAALPDYKSLISNLNYSMDVEPFEELLKQEDKIKVSQLYRSDFEVTTPDTRIVEVAAMMIFKDVRRVFVCQNENLVGVLLRKDIVSMVIRG